MSRAPSSKDAYNIARRKDNMNADEWRRVQTLNRAARKRNPNRAKWYRKADLKRYYGITPEAWGKMFEAQGRRCANPGCRSSAPGRKTGGWCTDHNHETGEVRGILCQHCNAMLGHAKDDPNRLLGGAKYLGGRGEVSCQR